MAKYVTAATGANLWRQTKPMKVATNLREPICYVPLRHRLRSINWAVVERFTRQPHHLKQSCPY